MVREHAHKASAHEEPVLVLILRKQAVGTACFGLSLFTFEVSDRCAINLIEILPAELCEYTKMKVHRFNLKIVNGSITASYERQLKC